MERIAREKAATPAQIAVAWILAQKPWIAPIPGSCRLGRLDENLRVADVLLTVEDLAELDLALANIEVVGSRY